MLVCYAAGATTATGSLALALPTGEKVMKVMTSLVKTHVSRWWISNDNVNTEEFQLYLELTDPASKTSTSMVAGRLEDKKIFLVE